MSKGDRNRRRRAEINRTPAQRDIVESLQPLNGLRIPGGCDECEAYQVIEVDGLGPNAHRLMVHHDDWCPVLQAFTERD